MEHYCEKCKYKTYLKQNYNKHINSSKHKSNVESTNICIDYKCIKCDKQFASKTTLWRHNKTCISIPQVQPTIPPPVIENNNINDFIIKLLEKHNFLEKIVIEILKNQPPEILNKIINNLK